jgi:hypothetical protein
LGRSGEGLRITQTDAGAQPNGEQGHKGQLYESSDQHRRSQAIDHNCYFGPMATGSKHFSVKISAFA